MSTNAKKILKESGVEKPKRERTRKVKVDMSTLKDAIVDGTFIGEVNQRVYFERTYIGKTTLHEGHVFKVDAETGMVTLWDETKGQFFAFSLKLAVPVVKLSG